MALDGQPAEPFPARNGAVVLAPGGRADVFIDGALAAGTAASILLHDGTEARPIARLIGSKEAPFRSAPLPPAAPLPSNGLPARLELKGALRVSNTWSLPRRRRVYVLLAATSRLPAAPATPGRSSCTCPTPTSC